MSLRATLLGATLLGAVFAGPALADGHTLKVTHLASYATGVFDEGAAEIVAYCPGHKRAFVVNGNDKAVDILDIKDPTRPTKVGAIDIKPYGGGINSVAVHSGVVAAAIEAEDHTQPGKIVFFDTSGSLLSSVEVGALPDMVAFSPDGKFVVAAMEGEPSDDYKTDPEGAVAIIDMAGGAKTLTQENVTLADFKAWNDKGLPEGARIGKPGATAAQDIEPEYVAISKDSQTAYVTLQENNAIAVVDLAAGKVSDVVGLGFKDHRVVPFDASNKDGAINIRTWPVYGMYMPDTITSFEVDGHQYIAIANEGDSRDYDGWSEEVRVKDLTLDPEAFPTAALLQKPENLGRLKTTTTMGDADGDGEHEEIYAYGGRSFSILDARGHMIFDSGSLIEEEVAKALPKDFNSSDDENDSFDDRSDDKGPEPEALTSGVVNGVPYVFVGLERVSGFMVFDVSDPYAPKFESYHNGRDFSGDPKAGTAGDISPEGMAFISAKASPNGKPLLLVANEISGSTAVYQLGE